jgi:4-amino-4-deoxy-L-arabinose transferase-like glycosyltransferase
MTRSWSNFFFGAFDPGGFITVDKPPVFLWIGAITARIFGYSSWALLLPSAAGAPRLLRSSGSSSAVTSVWRPRPPAVWFSR